VIRRDALTVRIPLSETRPGTFMASVDGHTIGSNARFVLIVRSDAPMDMLRRGIPAMLIISPMAADRPRTEQDMNRIPMRPLPMPPRHLPVSPDATCFELDPNSPNWPSMPNLVGFAIYMAGSFPDTQLELWIVDTGSDPRGGPSRTACLH
jgi:type VI secretion system protein ImpJ